MDSTLQTVKYLTAFQTIYNDEIQFKTIPIINCYFEAFCIGNSTVICHNFFHQKKSKAYMYDVEQDKWSNINCDLGSNLFGPFCVKYYKR